MDSAESVKDTNPVAGFLVLGSEFDCDCLVEETMETTVRAIFIAENFHWKQENENRTKATYVAILKRMDNKKSSTLAF